MEMSWNRSDFASQIKKLEDLVSKETDTRKRTYLEKVLDVTNKLYYDTFFSFPRSKVTAKQRMTGILDSTFVYNRYYSLVSAFFSEVSEHIELIDNISDKLEEIDPNGNFDFLNTGATISNDKLLHMVNLFYRNFDSEIYQVFNEAYKDRSNSVNIRELDDPDRKADGTTLFIDGVRKNFINIYRTDAVGTYECAVHEYGHAIANLTNPKVSYSDRDDFFAEVASIFPELVALYENNFNLDPMQIAYHLYSTLVTYVNSSEYLCLHKPVLNAWEDNKYVMNNNFFEKLEEYYDMDDECFEETLSTTIEDQGVYVLSYAVALELLHLYKKDKNKALYLFKSFLTYPANEDILAFVMENIPINSHVSEEAKIILDSFNKKLEMRRC